MEQQLKKLIVSSLTSDEGISLDAWNDLQELMFEVFGPVFVDKVAGFVRGTDNSFYVKEDFVEEFKELVQKGVKEKV